MIKKKSTFEWRGFQPHEPLPFLCPRRSYQVSMYKVIMTIFKQNFQTQKIILKISKGRRDKYKVMLQFKLTTK